MGYSTDFSGSLTLSRPTTALEKTYLDTLASTRRMQRDNTKLMELHKGAFGNPFAKDKTNPDEVYGFKGEYFAKQDGDYGQSQDGSILDYNSASGEVSYNQHKGDWDLRMRLQEELNDGVLRQPGLWLQWVLNEEGTELEWDGNEKFYNYIEWLQYLIGHFFEPWGIKLNGEIEWTGEDSNDKGKIAVTDNVIEVYEAVFTYQKKN